MPQRTRRNDGATGCTGGTKRGQPGGSMSTNSTKKKRRTRTRELDLLLLDQPDRGVRVPVSQKYGGSVRYPPGTPYEFRQPVRLRRKHRAPPIEDLVGSYDVLLESHVDGDDTPTRLTAARGRLTVTMENASDVPFFRDGENNGGSSALLSLTKNGRALCAEVCLGDESASSKIKYRVVANKEWTVERELREASLYFITVDAPDPRHEAFPIFAGSIGIISERAAVDVLTASSGQAGGTGWDPKDEEEDAACAAAAAEQQHFFPAVPFVKNRRYARKAEEVLRQYQRQCDEHWLCSKKNLPMEIVTGIRQFLFPPPVFFFEESDLWIYAAREKHGKPSHSVFVARRVQHCP